MGRGNEIIRYLTQKKVRKERKKKQKRAGGSKRKQYNGVFKSRSLNNYVQYITI